MELLPQGRAAAVGRIKALGRGRAFGYKVGDEILKLRAGNGGQWTGTLLWRNDAGERRWQPITMRRSGPRLHGESANEHCYEQMERAR